MTLPDLTRISYMLCKAWFFLAEAYFSADTGALVAFSRMWLKNYSEISIFFSCLNKCHPSVVVAQSDSFYCICQPRALDEVIMKRGSFKNLTKPINDNHWLLWSQGFS